MKYKVSVIVPVYNMQEYIEMCLKFIIKQTLNEIEILCIDDCSNDNSANIIKNYIEKDNRVKYIKLDKNSGSAIARNKGIDEANGEFVIFMDPDDYYYDDTVLEKLYSSAKEKNVKIVAGNMLAFDTQNNIKGKLSETTHFYNSGFYSFRDEYFSCFGYQSFLFSTQLLKDNNLYFPDYLRRQDPVFFLNVMLLEDRFFAIDYNIYVYRIFYKKVSWDIRKKQDFIEAYKENFNTFAKENLPKHFMTEFLDFKYHVLLENQFKIDGDIIQYVQETKKSISYDLLKNGFRSRIKENELGYIKQILQKFQEINKINKKIIIYGFGNIGIGLYEEIKSSFKVVKIIDKSLYDIVVDDIEISKDIQEPSSDTILIITVYSQEVKNEVTNKYVDMGFSKCQIL